MDELVVGVIFKLDVVGVMSKCIFVFGVFEIFVVILFVVESGYFDGYLVFGCVICGEISYYDYVCGESVWVLMDLVVYWYLLIGYGIFMVEN